MHSRHNINLLQGHNSKATFITQKGLPYVSNKHILKVTLYYQKQSKEEGGRSPAIYQHQLKGFSWLSRIKAPRVHSVKEGIWGCQLYFMVVASATGETKTSVKILNDQRSWKLTCSACWKTVKKKAAATSYSSVIDLSSNSHYIGKTFIFCRVP